MNFPSLLVLHEKYGEVYYLLNDKEDLHKFAMNLLTERFDSGHYYIEPKLVTDTFEQYFESVHNMTLEDAESLIKLGDGVRLGNRTPENEIKSMRNAYVYACAEVEEYENIVRVVKEENAPAAWRILYNRSREGCEYECFDLERFENVKDKDNV